jgi:hypothetical protein
MARASAVSRFVACAESLPTGFASLHCSSAGVGLANKPTFVSLPANHLLADFFHLC